MILQRKKYPVLMFAKVAEISKGNSEEKEAFLFRLDLLLTF